MKALSLFSGIGGIDLACEWAGIKTVAFCEREPFPQKVLRKHWPNVPIYDDVCTLTKERLEADGIGTIDIIHGGYPCQPFSNAGNRKGTEDDRHLWPEVFRLIQAIQPRWFVGENVAGHVTLGLDIVLADLDSIDYAWESIIIPAAAVNAPHRRDRVFIVAHPKSIDQGGLSIREKAAHTRFTFGGQDVADTQGKRCRETREHQSERTAQWTTGSSETLSDPTSPGLSIWGRSERTEISKETRTGMEPESKRRCEDVPDTDCTGRKEQHAATITDNSGFSTWGTPSGGEQWAIEPDVGRVANGVPQRVDRLKALGNAVVPQQIYPILAAIKQIDDMMWTV
ncbi:DNA (cytosine-5-)-methyltransferase [Paenibacillus periandrae]|uniref:DNA (cytosine-5-)-methyltransferase n=1 Tax=Paenibacillus periandrae TaxID=1761741 RepID=UPI001F0900DC|nr:DNA cytosine methyltransferase [Paenibacillus periandrae]